MFFFHFLLLKFSFAIPVFLYYLVHFKLSWKVSTSNYLVLPRPIKKFFFYRFFLAFSPEFDFKVNKKCLMYCIFKKVQNLCTLRCSVRSGHIPNPDQLPSSAFFVLWKNWQVNNFCFRPKQRGRCCLTKCASSWTSWRRTTLAWNTWTHRGSRYV